MRSSIKLVAAIVVSGALVASCGGFVHQLGPPPQPLTTTESTQPTLAGGSVLYDHIIHNGITFGVRTDLPGFASSPIGSNTPSGFEVTVAKYVAAKLGVPAAKVDFKQLNSSLGLQTVSSGDVTFYLGAVASDIAAAHLLGGGPYLSGGLSLLYRRSGPVIANPADAAGKKGCVVNDSAIQQTVGDLHVTSPDKLTGAQSLDECISQLTGDHVDFVVDSTPLLASGLLEASSTLALTPIPQAPPVNYLIAMPNDAVVQAAVNQSLRDMIQDGSWQRAYSDNLGKTGIAVTPPVIPQ